MTTIEQLNNWLKEKEDSHLEFKSARSKFSEDALSDYCSALANEGGGRLLLGVQDNGRVVGTTVFSGTHNKLSIKLLSKLKIRIDVEEVLHPDGRVVVFHIPAHPTGQPIKSTGKYTYPMRAGESLLEMDTITLKRLLNEIEPDFSCSLIPELTILSLDSKAIQKLKGLWSKKARRKDFLKISDEQMLSNLSLRTKDGLNYTCLILLGKREIIDQLLPDAEIIFEWRQDPKKTAYDFRRSWRAPFILIYDEIWETINSRNIRIPFQEGLIQREIFAFDEKSVREALLNAVTHRDYTIKGRSIFIKASPKDFFIESPGGFVPGITIENIISSSAWRNRRLAETFEKAGLVERSGQGMNDIFETTIKEGKGLPDLSESDAFYVRLNIPAQVKDKNFILFLEKVVNKKQIILSFEEIHELEKIREQEVIANSEYKKKFLDLGIIEQVGRTRGVKYILSHKYYAYKGKVGIHTRLTGLSRDQKKELILKHLKGKEKGFSKDFQDAFPELKSGDISNLLQELKRAGKVIHVGSFKSGHWILTGEN